MKKRMLATFTTDAEGLDVMPHVMPQLTAVTLGGSQLAPADLERLFAHLITCVDCQHVLRVLVMLKLHSAASEEEAKKLRKLLNRLKKIVHATQAQEKFGAYIDILEEQGEEQANAEFPVLAEHFRQCKACRRRLEEVLTLLPPL